MRPQFHTLIALLVLAGMAVGQDSAALHTIAPAGPADMRELFRYSGEPLSMVSSHRGGAMRGFPENCIATFENTLQHTPSLLEIDLRYTKDGRIVLLHDSTLDRTTTGTGPLSERTWAELKPLRLKDTEGRVTEFRIPTLDEALLWARGKTILVFDMKDVPVEAAIKKIEEHKAEAYTMLIVYSFQEAQAAYALNKNIMMEVILQNRERFHQFDALDIPWSHIIAFIGHEPPEDKELLRLIHAKGACCMAGTSRNLDRELMQGDQADTSAMEARYHALLEYGVDMIETDYPREVGAILFGDAALPEQESEFLQRR